MPFVSGFLRVRSRRGHPDQELPEGEGPVDPDYGIDEGSPEYPSIDPPAPPPGIWPPLTPERPWLPLHPDQGLPRPPVHPDQGLPGGPGHPDQGLPPFPGRPDQGLPGEPPTAGHLPSLPPGSIWPPLPPGVHGKYLALVLIAGMPGVRYRYVVIDADLRPDQGLPRPPVHPDQGLPPFAQPKT
jgi:hypothetical protein